MENNLIVEKSRNLAVEIISLYKYLSNEKREYIISKQILKSGTSIGANVIEAVNAQSKKEFIAKMNISLKEARETEYWVDLLCHADYIKIEDFARLNKLCSEVNRIITAIIKTSNENLRI